MNAPPNPASFKISADRGALWRTLVHLWPYIWPSDRADLKMRVVWATVLLLVAKLATIAVPFTFKWAVDALTGEARPPAETPPWLLWVFAAPVLLTVAYGGTRIVMALLTQVRDGLFAKVAMHAVRRLALITFEHMHLLSLRFHLERKTGGLTRVLERGRNGIETIVRMVILQLVPTIVELALIVGVLLVDVRLALRADHRRHRRALHDVHLLRDRVAHRHSPQDERQRHRRQHQGDRLAAQLRDGEVFRRRGARGEPLRPHHGALRGREREGLHLARRAQCRAGRDLHRRARRRDGAVRVRHPRRHQHGRRLRDDQRHDDPALPAAEFHGHGVSRDQAGGDRHRDHVLDPRARAGDRGHAGRQADRRLARRHPLRGRAIRLRAGAADPQRPELRGAGRPHRRDRRSLGRRQVDDLAAPVPLL